MKRYDLEKVISFVEKCKDSQEKRDALKALYRDVRISNRRAETQQYNFLGGC